MSRKTVQKCAVACLATLVASGCVTTPSDAPVRVETVTVTVPQPVPCPALAELGPEPSYPDTDAAIANATGIGPLAQLYRAGRALRNQRLQEYITARDACAKL